MFDKKHLRGDPNLPYLKDPKKAEELIARYVPPSHEPLWFYRNKGTTSPGAEQRWHDFQTIENIEVMRELGIHMPKRMHFFKGFGLERERPFIEKTIRYAKELHKRNMLVSVYIGGTLFTDYFFKEIPEARSWARVDMNGQPVTYSGYQLQRWFPCLNNPDYRAYTQRVLDVAVKEIEADEIFFDNQILRHEPRSCRCEHCVRHLREMVKRKYTLDECEQRYGLREYPDVMPPVYSQANKPWRHDAIVVPATQDWIDHRVATVVEFYKDMADHVRAQRPSCSVGMNIKGIHGHNRAFDHGICHGAFKDILDWTCIDGYRPGRKPGSDTFWSEVRLYKSAHHTHISVVDSDHPAGGVSMVESAVLNFRKRIEGYGWVGDDPIGGSPIGRFLCAHKGMYMRARCHDIAVLRSEPSTNYNCAKVHEQLMPFEQTLIAEQLPWGIIFDGNREELGKFRIVALPEIQALSDAWVEALDAFLRNGGGVIASGQAAAFDAWYRPRSPEHALARWLGHAPQKQYEAVNVGKGRFVYVPEWDVHTRWSFDDWFAIHGEAVKPVKDRALFRKAIADATVGRPLTHYVSGNDFVLVEAIHGPNGKDHGIDLHFINHDRANMNPVMKVEIGLPAGKRGAKVVLVDAENEPAGFPRRETDVRVEGERAVFHMPTPRMYGLAQVEFTA